MIKKIMPPKGLVPKSNFKAKKAPNEERIIDFPIFIKSSMLKYLQRPLYNPDRYKIIIFKMRTRAIIWINKFFS